MLSKTAVYAIKTSLCKIDEHPAIASTSEATQATMAIKVDCTSKDKRRRGGEYQQVVMMYGCDFNAQDVSELFNFFRTECSLEHPIRWIGIITTGPGDGGPGGRRDAAFILHNDDRMKIGGNMRLRQSFDLHWLEDAYDNGGRDIYPDWFLAKYPRQW